MKKRNRKAFTIVELVIVVAVIGVLAAVLIPTFVKLTQKANKASDDSLVRNLNTALAMAEGDDTVFEGKAVNSHNDTMHDAVIDLEYEGYHLENLTTRTGEKLLWNIKTNRFYLEGKAELDKYKAEDYWKIVKTTAEMTRTDGKVYSGYAHSTFAATSVEVAAGFDVGTVTTIKDISYINSVAKEVVIRTNGGTLTVNAENDEVTHYGQIDYVDIIAVKPASYKERGTTSLIKVAYGNVALNSESKVGQIHFAKTGDVFTDIKVTLESGAKLPALSRDPVGTSSLDYVLICEVVTSGTSEYYWLNGKGTIEDGEVLISSTRTGEKTAATAENSIALAIANAKTGENEASDTGKTVTEDNVQEVIQEAASKTFAEIGSKEELIDFRDAWNAGKLAGGQTFKLTANINISDEPWSPIGNQAHPFTGTFDGNGKTISGLSNKGYSIDINDVFTTDYSKATGAPYGLFGVVGSKDDNKASVTIKNLTLTNVHIENNKFNCVGAVIGGDVGAVKDKNNVYINGSYAGDIQLTNITVSGQKVYGLDGVGGLIGKIYTLGNVEVTGCASSVDVYAVASTNKKVAAVVGYANGGVSYNISGNTISGNVYANDPSDGLLDQVANIKKVQLSYIFGVGDNTCTNKLYLLENNEYVEYKMPYVISHERDKNGNVTRSVITYINEAEPGVKYIPDNRQDLCDGTLVLNMNDSIYAHRFSAYNTLTGSIEFRNCTIGTGMSDLQFTNTTSVLFKDCDIVCGNSIYMIVFGGSLTLDLGTHTCHRTVQICKGGSNATPKNPVNTNQVCPVGTSIYVVSGTFTNTIYNHGQENGVIYIQGGLFTFVESQYGINKISGRENDAFVITGGTFNKTYGASGTINISNYIPSTHQLNEENDQYVVVAKQQ